MSLKNYVGATEKVGGIKQYEYSFPYLYTVYFNFLLRSDNSVTLLIRGVAIK
jgi:hypothetical protein